MSISGIQGTNFSSQPTGAHYQRLNADFRQLGKDLQVGDISAARQDYSGLQLELQQPDADAMSAAIQSKTPSTGGRHHPLPPSYGPPVSIMA